jgi:hypothetical protein
MPVQSELPTPADEFGIILAILSSPLPIRASRKHQLWTRNVSTLSELLRKVAAGSGNEAGAEQVG